jgi:hypothetical protein
VLKKKLDRGAPSSKGMTMARVAKLEAIRFTRSLAGANFAGREAQLAKLKKYKRKHGDCNVPQG